MIIVHEDPITDPSVNGAPVAGLHGDFAAHFNAFRIIVQDLPDAEQRRLFHDNAAAFYRL